MNKKISQFKPFAIFLAGVFAISAPAAARADWAITSLGTLGGTGDYNWISGINNAGQMAVTTYAADSSSSHAFLYSNGVMTDLSIPGAVWNSARGINNSGQVVGLSYAADYSTTTAFVTGANGVGATYLPGHYALDINDSGQVVGGTGAAPFIYSNGTMSYLSTLGGSWAEAMGINDSGQVMGMSWTAGDVAGHVYLYSNGTMSDLGTLGGSWSDAWTGSINNSGQVVGLSSLAGEASTHAFLYSNGVMSDLGTLGGANSEATDLNNFGQVVGISGMSGDATWHSFLYSNGATIDLDMLAPVAAAGWTGLYAQAINDNGQIAGYGTLNGTQQVFLLSGASDLLPHATAPVPEPETWAMLLAGLGLLGFTARRRKIKGATLDIF